MAKNTVEVKVRLVGNLRKYGPHEKDIEIEDGKSIGDIVEKLGIPEEEEITVMVNEEPKYMHYRPKEGDVIDLLRNKSLD